MFKKLLVSTASAATIALAACGGGGGADPITPPDTGGNNPPPPTQYNVAGPMDAVQAPMSSTVFGQLEAAADGTPLKALLVCADRTVNHDALDFADSIANALQAAAANGTSSATALASTAPALNSSVMQLANDLQGLLNSIAGAGGCGTNGLPVGAVTGSNPLAGTPLSPLGTELMSVLANIRTAHPGSGGTTLPLATLYALVSQLRDQFDVGLAGINTLAPETAVTPLLSGTLLSVQQMLHDLEGLMQAVAATDPTAAKASLNALLDHSIANQLTRIVPLRFVEQQASQVGFFSLPVESGAGGVADLFTDAVGTVYTTQALKTALGEAFEPVVDPIATQVLPVFADQLVVALLHMQEIDDASTGTQLDDALGALSNLLGPVGGVGQPVNTVLSLIAGSVQSGSGGLPVCPSTNPLLNLLCGL
jgi:hypothetical protein